MRRVIGKVFLAAAGQRLRAVEEWRRNPVPAQEAVLRRLVAAAARTRFGREHRFESIRSVGDYQARVPLRSYLDFKPYWDRLWEGERDVTWPGSIGYLAVTSGTTAGNKFIPVSEEGLECYMRVGRDVLNFYFTQTRDTELFCGRFLYLGGSTDLKRRPHGVQSGDLSGIVSARTPSYVSLLQLPSPRVVAMTDWEKKLNATAQEAATADVRGLGGTPSWLVCLFDRVLKIRREVLGRPARTLADVWPNLSLLVHGGVNFDPYRSTFETLFGKPVHTLEVYPASEGFIGVEDKLGSRDLLLMMDTGLFYEFVPVEELGSDRPARCTAADAQVGVNYAIVVTTNSGLWSYIIGDTVRFTSLRPHRVRVTGRTQHFLSAFGEHVIVEEVEAAMTAACAATGAEIQDFHVAPLYPGGPDVRPAHQWLVEFLRPPPDLERFRSILDETMRRRNDDYAAHRQGDAGMRPPEVVALPANTFYRTMKELGRFGAQNKAPRLRNDRQFADALLRAAAPS